jgi:serine/threonine protein kinase
LDARSDIFSFGVVLYELVNGQRPFAGNSEIDIFHAIVHDPQPRSKLRPGCTTSSRSPSKKTRENAQNFWLLDLQTGLRPP